MLSYRHGFHAGGWADVHKHVVLTALLLRLGDKATPYTVLDAFAGDGVYTLDGAEARKTGEHRAGISQVFAERDGPPSVDHYLSLVRNANPGGPLAIYPGSPALARDMLRREDHLILNELHPTAYAALRRWALDDRKVATHQRDAAEFLGAFATPKLRRGLVLLDPAYEVKSEYEQMAELLPKLVRSWPTGIFALWFPRLPERRESTMLAALARELGDFEAVVSEIGPVAPALTGMQGAGMVVINPPWKFTDELRAAGDWLTARLWPAGQGHHLLADLSALRASRTRAI